MHSWYAWLRDFTPPHSHLLDSAHQNLWRYVLKGQCSFKNLAVYGIIWYMLSETVGIRSNMCLPLSVSSETFCHSRMIQDFRTLLMIERGTGRWWSMLVCLVACFVSSSAHSLPKVPLCGMTWPKCVLSRRLLSFNYSLVRVCWLLCVRWRHAVQTVYRWIWGVFAPDRAL